MTEPLALKYRPKTFADMVGQPIPSIVLPKMVEEGSVPQALLFSGPRGSGKTSAARVLADAMGVEYPIEVDAASHGLVDDVREMIETLRFSTGSNYRVVIYDEAHSMTPQAFNALLKTLEEPPADTIFILVTTEPEKIPETVKSRLTEFSFRKISPQSIKDRLYKVVLVEQIDWTEELLDCIVERSDGSLRDALTMLDQCWRASISDKDTFLEMVGEADVAPDLILAMLTGDHNHIFDIVERLTERVPDPSRLASMIIQTLKEVLVIKAGAVTADDRRKQISLHLESERVVAAMKMLWDLKTRVRQSTDPRANLDLVLVLITDIFTQGKAPISKPVYVKGSTQMYPVEDKAEIIEESRRLTLAEL